MFAFNNKGKAQKKAKELAPHFSFGDNEVLKDEDWDRDLSYEGQWLYSGTINAKKCFVLYRKDNMPYANGAFADADEAARWVDEKGRADGAEGACFPVKLKGGMGSVSIWDMSDGDGTELFTFDKYTENDPDFDWYADKRGPDGRVLPMYASKTILESFKYVPTFKSFIGG